MVGGRHSHSRLPPSSTSFRPNRWGSRFCTPLPDSSSTPYRIVCILLADIHTACRISLLWQCSSDRYHSPWSATNRTSCIWLGTWGGEVLVVAVVVAVVEALSAQEVEAVAVMDEA